MKKQYFYKYIYLFAFIFLAFQMNLLKAQNVEFEKAYFPGRKAELSEAKSQLEKGNKLFEAGGGNYLLALEPFTKANNFNPNNALLNYRLGICYLYTIQKNKSIAFFEKAIQLNPAVAPDIHLVLGEAYQLNYDLDKAISEFKKYQQNLSPFNMETERKSIEKKIKECETGKDLVAKPVRVSIDNLGSTVNSIYPDYSPIVNADETVLIFTSRRADTYGGNKDPFDNMYFEDVYFSYKKNNIWTLATNADDPINTKSHDATVGLSPDAHKLFVYRGDKGGDIYVSALEGDKWSTPKKLPKPINLTESQETSASFTYNGTTIFFVSDRLGGYGGKDIYTSTLGPKGKWSEPTNLGAAINTEYDEEGVFMHPDGKTMYFSSQGHNTMGGFDIFKSVYEDGKWSEPENIGYPINTPDNDVFLTVSASGKHGYYSSTQTNGMGDDDIYMISFLVPEKPLIASNEDNLLASLTAPVSETVIEKMITVNTAQLTILKGKILDEKTRESLAAIIKLTDNSKNELLATFESNSTTGEYLISLPSGKNYSIAVEAQGYLFYSENQDIPTAAQYQEIINDILLKKIEVGKSIVLRNIFFDTGKSTLRPESYAELGILYQLLSDNPKMRIEISGHTDNKGSAALNKKLSESRAKSVVDYLISKGIDASRLEYKGYGFDMPIAPNDTEAGRQQNRRTEFKVIGTN
ncbi:MAG: hypothetical protein AUJ97_00090 [Bacteroidetes bacterium CG2_30_32_10]|nr:MAG: hypothetical protein AUJ97_00090 [Bacteroidetes bacterium CG2_30_32_10]